MTTQELENKTNEELKSLIEDLEDNHNATINIDAKNPNKPNKTELVAGLKAYFDDQNALEQELEEATQEPEVGESPELEEEKPVITLAKDLPRSQRVKLQRADLMRKECVLIIDQRKTQTPDRAIFVSWGNRAVGHHTDVVHFTGKPQYVRRGALNNLRDVTLNEPISNADNPEDEIKWARGPRFIITPAEGLTEEELRKKVVEQQIKAANTI